MSTATVRDAFCLHGRGLVLVLDEFDGAITGPGVVRGAHGASWFSGPEIADFAGQSSAIAVIALDLDAENHFAKGDMVSFGPEPSAA